MLPELQNIKSQAPDNKRVNLFCDASWVNAFGSKNNFESIQNIMNNIRNEEWLNYPIAFIVVLFPTMVIAFALNIGAVFNEYKIKFTDLFKITLKSQLIFAINYLIATVLKWQGLVERHYGNINNNYDFQSLAYFFKDKGLPFWIMYPMQNISITEIIHILVLSYGFSLLTQQKYLKSLGVCNAFLWNSTTCLDYIYCVFTSNPVHLKP